MFDFKDPLLNMSLGRDATEALMNGICKGKPFLRPTPYDVTNQGPKVIGL